MQGHENTHRCRRYDSARVLAVSSATVRDEAALNKLAVRLVAVVEETMQPAHVTLWLRPAATLRRLAADPGGQRDDAP